MNVSFTENALQDYLYWQKTDKKTVKRIHELIRDIKRSPFEGIGKTEGLKYDLAGKWSRRAQARLSDGRRSFDHIYLQISLLKLSIL